MLGGTRLIALILAGMFLAGGLLAQVPGRHVEGEILIKFKAGTPPAAVVAINRAQGTRLLPASRGSRVRRIGVPPGRTMASLIAWYESHPAVEYAEPNMIAEMHVDVSEPMWVPNDMSYQGMQWHFDNGVTGGIEMEQAWGWMIASELPAGGTPNVTVAVLDTGVAYEYNPGKNLRFTYYPAPDLVETAFSATGYDFVNDDAHPNDDEGHGTHVTGTIAQATDNDPNDEWDYAVAGIADGVTILPVKVLDSAGSGTHEDIAAGINWAVSQGAHIINMSLGGGGSQTLEAAVINAYNAGVLIVCSAGNSSSSAPSYPAAYKQCISVAAADFFKELAYYSNYGETIDIIAPGGDLNAVNPINGYSCGILQQTFGRDHNVFDLYFYQGTSMAAPHVSGVAALVLSYISGGEAFERTAASRDLVREALLISAEDLGAVGRDSVYGWGHLNAVEALKYVSAPVPPPSEPPLAKADTATVAEDAAVVIDVLGNDSDPDGDSTLLTVLGVTQPANGETVVNADDTVTYTPDADFNGTDTFSYTISDDTGAKATGSVTVTVTPVNDMPVAVDDAAETAMDTAAVIDVLSNDSDVDGDVLSVIEVTVAAHGLVVINGDGTVTYTPDVGFSGEDSFEYIISDGNGGTATATVTVDVIDTTPPTEPKLVVTIAPLSAKWAGPNLFVTAGVTVTGDTGVPVDLADVTVAWSFNGGDSTTTSGQTDAQGTVELTSPKVRGATTGDTMTATVTLVSKAGYAAPDTPLPSGSYTVE